MNDFVAWSAGELWTRQGIVLLWGYFGHLLLLDYLLRPMLNYLGSWIHSQFQTQRAKATGSRIMFLRWLVWVYLAFFTLGMFGALSPLGGMVLICLLAWRKRMAIQQQQTAAKGATFNGPVFCFFAAVVASGVLLYGDALGLLLGADVYSWGKANATLAGLSAQAMQQVAWVLWLVLLFICVHLFNKWRAQSGNGIKWHSNKAQLRKIIELLACLLLAGLLWLLDLTPVLIGSANAWDAFLDVWFWLIATAHCLIMLPSLVKRRS